MSKPVSTEESVHPQEQKADGGHSGVRVTDLLSHASCSSPGFLPLPLFPKQPFTWTARVLDGASPWFLATEESKLEAVSEVWSSATWAVQCRPRQGLGQTARCAVGKLRTRVIQGLRIKVYSQTVPSPRGLGGRTVREFTTLAAPGITSL